MTEGSAALPTEVELLRRSVTTLTAELAGLRRAMQSRALIDQAKGAVRVLTGASDDEAFALLSARSQHENRKLATVAADVLAAVDTSPERHHAVTDVLHGSNHGSTTPAQEPVTADGWQPRRRVDRAALAVTDPRQLLAVADLAELLTAAATRDDVVDVLVGPGADAMGAFAAAVASRDGTGRAVDERLGAPEARVDGVHLGTGPAGAVALDAAHPIAEALRTGSSVVLPRAELALRFPAHPRPPRLQGVAVLPLQTNTARGSAWALYYDHPPTGRSTRAMLDWAARLASTALNREP